MERKWLNEKSLREAAETKVKTLKKKLRTMKESGSSHAEAEEVKEDASVATHQTTSASRSRSNSLDGLDLAVDHTVVAVGENNNSSGSHLDLPKAFSADSTEGENIEQTTTHAPPVPNSTGQGAKTTSTTQLSPPRDSSAVGSHYGQAVQNPKTPPATQKKMSAAGGPRAPPAQQQGASGQSKPNLVMNQQQQQQQKTSLSPVSNFQHKASAYLEPNQQTPPVARPPFAGGSSRPMGSSMRNESTGSLALSRRSVSCDFDPLGPLAQDLQSDDGLSVSSGMNPASVQLYSTPVYMMDSQIGHMGQTMTMFTSQAPMMQVATHQIDPSSGMPAQGYQQQRHPTTHNRIPSGSMFLVPPQVSFLEQPTLSATNGTQETTTATMMQPQMMMTFQQSPFEQQHQGQWVQQQQQQPSPPQQQQPSPPQQQRQQQQLQQQQQQQQQQPYNPQQQQQQQMTQSNMYAPMPPQQDVPLQQQDSSGSQGAAVDPFEALVQQRTNN